MKEKKWSPKDLSNKASTSQKTSASQKTSKVSANKKARPVQAKKTAAKKPLNTSKKATTSPKSSAAAPKNSAAASKKPASKSVTLPKNLTDLKSMFSFSKENKTRAIIVAGVIVFLFIVYICIGLSYRNKFFPNTSINGEDFSSQTIEEVNAYFTEKTKNYTLTLNERDGKSETLTNDEMGLKRDFSYISEIKAKQGTMGWLPAFIFCSYYDVEPKSTCDEALLNASIQELNAVSGPNVTAPVNATLAFDENGISIVKEVIGNTLDTTILAEQIEASVAHFEPTLDLEAAGCYLSPTITSDSELLTQKKAEAEKLSDVSITYTFWGSQKELINSKLIKTWLAMDEDGEIYVDSDKARAYLEELAEKYDTLNKTRTFTTSTGAQISVSPGTYGWETNVDGELPLLLDLIRTGENTTKEMSYIMDPFPGVVAGNDIGKTYVEIDLESQHMWYYKNGSLIVSTDIVSGDSLDPGKTTPNGVYYLLYKEENATLKGDRSQGYTYETPVSYWLPFTTSGIGIHDSIWRAASEYGGTSYQGNGSHGCINTPLDQVQPIFENIETGTPIVVYNSTLTE